MVVDACLCTNEYDVCPGKRYTRKKPRMATSKEKACRKGATCLLPAFKDTLPIEERDPGVARGSGTIRSDSGNQYSYTSDSSGSLTSCMRWLLPCARGYPEEKLRQRIQRVVVESRDAGTSIPDASNDLGKRLTELMDSLAVNSPWMVLLGVRGVAVDSQPMQVANVDFRRMTQEEFVLWGRRLMTGLPNPPPTTNPERTWMQQHAALVDQAIAVTQVNASDQEHARHCAKETVSLAFDVLRYGMLFLRFEGQPVPEFGIGQPLGTIVYPEHFFCMRVGQPAMQVGLAIATASGATREPAGIAPGWNEFEALLRKDSDERTEMEKRLVTALRWVGQAALTESNAVRIVCYVTAMEALLLAPIEAKGKREKLKKRISQFRQIPTCMTHFGESEVEKVYKLRCKCVHDGEIEATKNDERLAFNTLVQCFDSLLCDDRFNSFETLAEVHQELGETPKDGAP